MSRKPIHWRKLSEEIPQNKSSLLRVVVVFLGGKHILPAFISSDDILIVRQWVINPEEGMSTALKPNLKFNLRGEYLSSPNEFNCHVTHWAYVCEALPQY
jgi:hypothetical protein